MMKMVMMRFMIQEIHIPPEDPSDDNYDGDQTDDDGNNNDDDFDNSRNTCST